MSTLLLNIDAPIQSWGRKSRFRVRETQPEPTKSGIVGLLAAALGRDRNEPIDDLARLPMAVRTDQPGNHMVDFQTAIKRKFDNKTNRWATSQKDNDKMPPSHRHYITNAIFTVAIQVNDKQADTLAYALDHPTFPLYFGRRACPPAARILIDVLPDDNIVEALKEYPWAARNRQLLNQHKHDEFVSLAVIHDATDDDKNLATLETIQDVPISFSQERRLYTWRTVVHDYINVPNPHFETETVTEHDPMAVLATI